MWFIRSSVVHAFLFCFEHRNRSYLVVGINHVIFALNSTPLTMWLLSVNNVNKSNKRSKQDFSSGFIINGFTLLSIEIMRAAYTHQMNERKRERECNARDESCFAYGSRLSQFTYTLRSFIRFHFKTHGWEINYLTKNSTRDFCLVCNSICFAQKFTICITA